MSWGLRDGYFAPVSKKIYDTDFSNLGVSTFKFLIKKCILQTEMDQRGDHMEMNLSIFKFRNKC